MLTELRRRNYDAVPVRDIAQAWQQLTHAPYPVDEIYSRVDRGVIYGPSPVFTPITPAIIQRRRREAKRVLAELQQTGQTLVAQREAIAFDRVTCLQCDHILPNSTTRFYRFENSSDIDIAVSKEGEVRIKPRIGAHYNHVLLDEEALHAFAKHNQWEAPFTGRVISLDVQQLTAFFESPFKEEPTEFRIEKTSYQRPTA